MKEESIDSNVPRLFATVPGLNAFHMPKSDVGVPRRLDVLATVNRQSSIRSLNADQMNRFRHLLPPRLMNSHHQFHDPLRFPATSPISHNLPFSFRPGGTTLPSPGYY